MAKAKTRRKDKKDENVIVTRRRFILPPEILRMVLQYFETDKETLRACSQAAHEFRHVALSFLGRHITVNDVDRVKECTQMLTRGAFQHIRSLDLGIINKSMVLEEYWKDYIAILGSFAQYRSLTRLWLSEVPFNFLKTDQKENLRETITNLGSTVTELGLYGCHFSSYEELISLIRSFPLCNFLFIVDCVTGEQASGGNALAGLPEHKLTVQDLQLSASSSDVFIDVSNIIEDAALNVGSLTSLVCDLGTAERTQRVAAAVSASPVKQFQMACPQPEGFQAFIPNLSKWTLKSLTIGPQLNETDTEFLTEAFKDLPPLRRVDNVTVIYNYPRSKAFNTEFWSYLDRTLSRKDLFPALRSLRVLASCRSYPLSGRMRGCIQWSLRAIIRDRISVFISAG